MTRPEAGGAATAPLQIEFDDNSLLPMLFGEHDRHLARIEQRLGVRLSSRGNRVVIEGPHSASETARAALAGLYARLRSGQEVEMGDVDAATRLAAAPDRADDARDLFGDDDLVVRTRKRRVTPRTPGQIAYLRTLRQNELVFGLGPAGTGKTYLAMAMALTMLKRKLMQRIVLTRPAVEAGEALGFLPGDMREKVAPYLRPLYDAIHDMLDPEEGQRYLDEGTIEIAPLAFMRGRTLARSFVILDEAQNTTREQMFMALTRLGDESKMVVTGDGSQVDLKPGVRSGLSEAEHALVGVEGIAFQRFSQADIIRHAVVGRIVEAYERHRA